MKNASPRILVIDDEQISRRVIIKILRQSGYATMPAEDGEAGLSLLRDRPFDAVIADQRMPKLDGIELLQKINELGIDIPVIMVTGHASIERAVKAMQLGAAHYLTKPVNPNELHVVLRRALEHHRLRDEVVRLRKEVGEQYRFGRIIYKSRAMQSISELISDIAKTDTTVLILGETGTGKEVIAKEIHYNSARKEHALVSISCAAISETLLESELFGHEKGAFTGAIDTRIGRFEQAHHGTVFLDEICDIPLTTQVKLLRVLQEREFERVGGNETIDVDVRVISATNGDLQKAMREERFREDLYYRLNVMVIQIPPLRERLEDVPPLAFHFLQEYAGKSGKEIEDIAPEAIQLLLGQRWPGNVRQLQNVIERGVVLEKDNVLSRQTVARCLQPDGKREFQFSLNENVPFREAKKQLVDRFEHGYVTRLLDQHAGNIRKAARAAGLDYKNFYEKMKKHGISKWDHKG